eukprot:TRINITY_DN1846_c0_g1_i1.p1 TRINITY_DN1846_c0_g1~~TRINITY_DN1846_c0_g1_i1.p1  ORF type:complete len:316 (-),score=89.87 TRINITY_DN1846_c0_g1_i1:27-974(-)
MINPIRAIIAVALGIYFCASAFIICLVLQIMDLVYFKWVKDGFRKYHILCNQVVNIYWIPMVSVYEKWGGIKFEFYGDEIPMRENGVLIISNHRDLSDWLMMLAFGLRKGRMGSIKFFIKEIVKYVPGIGWGLSILQMVYLSRSWDKDKQKIENTFKNIKKNQLPFWLITFLEGTRMTPKKREESNNWAKKEKNLEPLENLLHPRIKGFVATVSSLQNEIDAVYDMTFAGNIPTIFQALSGVANTTVHIHIKRYTIKQIPTTEEKLEEWCRDVWYNKDKMLTQFSKEKKFPNKISLPFKINGMELDKYKPKSKNK